MNLDSKIFIAGHNGLVGSSILKCLISLGYSNILTINRNELDLSNQIDVKDYFEQFKPEYVFMCAAKVGGIRANSEQKGSFIYDNLMIQTNIIHNSYIYGVKKLLFLGSSCIYPKLCTQPIKEEYLMSGYLEESNDAYSIAKIAGIKMCQSYNQQYGANFISVMPTNLYGIGDNYHPENSHVIPGLIYKIHMAKVNNYRDIICWGDGTPKREFLFNLDLAEACIFLMNNYNSSEPINVGTGIDITIKELAETIKDIIYPKGNIIFNNDVAMNGTPRKVLDITKIKTLGWRPSVLFIEGIKLAYQDYLSRQ